jgi:hypothetical protein
MVAVVGRRRTRVAAEEDGGGARSGSKDGCAFFFWERRAEEVGSHVGADFLCADNEADNDGSRGDVVRLIEIGQWKRVLWIKV